MSALYDQSSPYYSTLYSEYFLDVMSNRAIPKMTDDQFFTINLTYQYRPDLLANDVYGNAGLWWVFYQRNPNIISKPPVDFTVGTQIYLPKITTLQSVLGI